MMEGMFVKTNFSSEKDIKDIIKSKIIGKESGTLTFQPHLAENIPIIFCSYICPGYPEAYSNKKGVSFETDSPLIYAFPVDSAHLIRGGNWLPGYERFIFSSLNEMFEKYPTSLDFKKDFQEYFKKLQPEEVYPGQSFDFAELKYRNDYCLHEGFYPWNPGCNEVTFSKPLKIKNCKSFFQ